MNTRFPIVVILLGICVPGVRIPIRATADELTASDKPTLDQVKTSGAVRSSYRDVIPQATNDAPPQANLKAFRAEIEPMLKIACYECHGAETAEGEFRVDTLDPDLLHGEDVDRWLKVSAAITNGEMPPEDSAKLADDDRSRIIEWLSSQVQVASQVRRAEAGHSSFRRMTRYEYNYALQDLLGLELDFAKDLPPDPVSEDGFRNSSEMLRMSPSQYADYLEFNRNALNRATVRGERPEVLYWGVSAERASAHKFPKVRTTNEQAGTRTQQAQTRGNQRGGRDDRGGRGAHYKNTATGQTVPATWEFRAAKHAWAPETTRPSVPEPSDYISVLPAGERLVVELGNRLPDEGTLRVRIRAWRSATEPSLVPSVALEFGWQGNNNSKASFRISDRDLVIDAPSGKPEFYQWDIPLSEIYPRNPVRKTVELGTPKRTNPSEYIQLHNTSPSRSADVQFDYVEVSAPVYEQWPPASHTGIFIDRENSDENAYAREIVSRFMARAWRRSVTDAEVDRKMEFFVRIRPDCEDIQQAVIETLATVLSSPRFLYLVQTDRSPKEADRTLDEFELATRLSMFLWCSTPDDELLDLAAKRLLGEADELIRQTNRMLAGPRHERFSNHFVRQWLNMQLLDYLTVDSSTYPQFDSTLKEAMQQEPIALFEEVLQNDRSVMDFLHADYAMVNQRLAEHYGISDVYGNHFRKVSLKPEDNRGGLLTQAGLLAMNSDGTDSHPLKRGIWLLESLLNDPPPPPPPAVPEIDLADPEILKLTLKERMEDHRNKPACISCHVKIDPWGIAFENFDAVGSWRTQNKGKDIDASSLLFNQHKLDGVDGLKRYLLVNRQDQFARAIVHKLTTFALGRPLSFGDRASVDRMTAEFRKEGDGLATLIRLIVTSDVFQSR
jgi:mono/diheme cytochrome c family protein